MPRLTTTLLAPLTAVTLVGCATPVMQQRIPIATDPPGATARSDSGAGCVTPCALSLDRNRDHIVSLDLAGYEHQDVIIRREYRTADVLLSAINSGLSSARNSNNLSWALQSGLANKSAQEASGAAYDLQPSVISVRMRPAGGFASVSTPPQAQQALGNAAQVLTQLQPNDEHMLEHALEVTATGTPSVWTNPDTTTRFAVVPDNVELVDGQVIRPFSLSTTRGNQVASGQFRAMRVGRGEWQLLAPAAGAALAPAVRAPDSGNVYQALPLGNPIAPPGQAGPMPTGGSGVDVSNNGVLRTLDALGVTR